MVDHVTGTSPLSHALQSLGVSRPAPEQKPDPKTAFDRLSRETNVPANVLIALDEAEGGAGDLDRARRNADFLGQRLAGGAKIEDAVAELAGDAERAANLMGRSYDIADALYPEPEAPEAKPGIGSKAGTGILDFAKAAGSGAVNMTGGAVQALGAFADDAMRQGARAELAASGGDPSQVQGESVARSWSRAGADAVRGIGGALAESISEGGKKAMQGSQPGGELFDPSTWSAGDDPSIEGYLLNTAQGLGSMIPVAAAAAVGGPYGAAAMGGLGAAGEGAQSGRDFVTDAQGREGEAGPAAVEAMPGYRALRDQGMSHDDAVAELARLAESESAAWQAIPGTLGGAATGKILSRAEGVLNAGGRAARAAKKGLAGAIEEGAQEAAEGMASQQGVASATGADVNIQQDSLGNFVLGALSGGAMGAGAGVLGSRHDTGGVEENPAPGPSDADPADPAEAAGDGGEPLALPAPENGGTIFGMSETQQEPGSFDRDPSNPSRPGADQSGAGAQFRPAEPPPAVEGGPDAAAEAERIFRAQPDTLDLPADAPVIPEVDGEFTEIPPITDTGPDGSGAGAVAAPGDGSSLSVPPGAAATNPIPAGPVERIAQSIAATMPPALPEPPARFPDQKPGGAVRFGDPASGQIIDGVFLGETEAGARVRVQGREIDLTPEQFDAGRDAVGPIEEEQKRAEQEAKQAAKALPAPKQEAPADVEPRNAGQAASDGVGDTGIRMDDAGARGGEGSAPGRSSEPEGRPEGEGVAAPGLPASAEGQQPGSGGVGGLDVADDAGQLRGSLSQNEALTAPPPSGAEAQQNKAEKVLTPPETAQVSTAPEWPWRGKKMNTRTRGRAIADYFAPGNIVESYGGGRDRVVSFDPKAGAITVEAVEQRDGEWVPAGERRTHSTLPEDRALRRGPLARAPSPIDAAAAEAHPEPTDAQKEAGNYRKGHVRWNGLDLSIENAKGSERRGTGPDGTEWSVTMPAHYGYFKRTEASDGDHVDFYMGDNPDAANAYVIDQVDAESGAYDEAKVMIGFDSAAAARAAHEAAFSDGKGAARLGGIKKMPIADLKTWLASDATKKPVSMRAGRAAAKPAPAPQKRPLMTYVVQRLGGINPTGKVAEELRHRGVNARTAPGLWRRAGHKDLDNIPAQDHPDLEALVVRSDDGIYLDPARIIEAMVEEVAGRPQPLGEQAVLQQQARANEEAADHARQQEAVYEIVPPGDDPRPAEERASSVEGTVDAFLKEYAPGHLTESERVDMIEFLVKDGGNIDLAVYDAIMRRPLHDSGTAESEISGVPFRDAGSGERSEPERSGEGGSEPAGDDSGRPAAERGGSAGEGERDGITPAVEAGAEGKPQTVIPGAEHSDAQAQQAEADRARSEMQARQQQSKIRRAGGNDGDPGPLFDAQNDLFSASAAPSEPAKVAKIQDFGEKITGARKDVWASYADQMRDAADVDVSAEPLSKSWPAPDYEKLVEAGVEPWKVSFIRAARDSIPTKPQKSWRLSGWVDAVTGMRGLAQDVMDGKIGQDKLHQALAGGRAQSEILGQVKLYEAVGHGKSLKGMTLGEVSYSMLAGVRYEKPKAFWEVSQKAKATAFSNMPRTIARAETEAEAIEQFKRAYGGLDDQKAKAQKARKWLIYSHDGRKFFTVGTKIGSTYIQLRRVDDVKEARRIIAEEADALQEQLDRLREIPADRKPENAPRVGIDHRSGADVTPEVFGETFGFRGVQFGNWVGGGRRQQDLNDAFDALMDLAGVLDIPPRALSLNGTLGLAFGARGTGGVSPAAAHYEPDQVVINLTKMNGAGSLAHEWFHALDNYFARAATDKKGNYITDRAVGTGARAEGVRPEVMAALIVLRRAIANTGLKARSANIDKTRSKAYWSTGIEMHARAFESYVIAKLQDQSIANDYLANIVNGVSWQMKAELSGLGDSYPYLKTDEIDTVRPAFDALFDAIQTRETEAGIEMYRRDLSAAALQVPTSSLRGLADAVGTVMRQHGLAGKISPKVVRVLLDASGVAVTGSYRAGGIDISARAADPTHVARHEIIHALRDPAIWGRRHGLFTAAEWQALARAARRDPVLRQAVERAYPELSTPGQTEEMVAEMYADWARARDSSQTGPLRAALERIASFFRAMAAALRGEGFADAAQVMERIASGEIGRRGQGPNSGAEGDTLYQRRPVTIESAVIAGDLGSLSGHPDYEAAKAGDIEAAVRVAQDIVTDDMVQKIREVIGDRRPVIVPVVSEEASGRNKIPRAAAEVLAMRLGLETAGGIGQRNAPRRTSLKGLDRIFASPEFDGPVTPGQDYLILDDTLTQGGTFAALAGHIEAGGGRVIGAVALTGKQYSAKLRPSGDILSALREKHGDLENDFRAATGHGFDSLTESEARYLTNFKPADAIRVRILDEGRRRGARKDQGDDPAVKHQRNLSALKEQLSRSGARAKGMIGNLHWKNAPGFFSSLLTDAMGKNDTMNILSLVPGNPLFEELGKGISAAQKYLREKQAMDAWRNDWQARAAAVVDGWTKQARKNPAGNDQFMDLMHASTLAGVDPSREGSWRRPIDDEAWRALKQPNLSPERQEWAQGVIRAANDRERTWQRLKADFDALPAEFRDLYQQIRDEYGAMADEQDAALMQNIRTASKIALKRADREHRKELQRIRDEGLTGEERAQALEKANKRKTDAHARAARGGGARLQQLRQMFEANRLAGPYFPLARFGNYFVTIRDAEGKVTSFSRFQTEREQKSWIETATERGLGKVEHGVLGGDANLKSNVDPTFVAEVESLLADAGATDEMMDAVWQSWLETLPDQSVRTNRIHRKGRLGFNKDAVRAFSSAMFHGAHQTARLRHGLEMQDSLDDAEEQAKTQADPNRAGFIVREMRQRHAFTMSPTNNPLVSAASGLAFVWYLGMSPASALVNLSQTTIVGVPVMAARFRRAGVSGTTAELARALRDFGAGRGWSEKSDRLSADEKAAMKAGYDRGVIDKTQSHDLAAVAESGVEYNPTREKVMRVIGWGFHHTERMNREVTFLAAYRMARAEGLGQAEAVDEASRQVWKVHFDYQNTSRPRVMQSDMGKILTTFRNFTVNMLYRLFRDAHQSFAGADAETQREARAQLIGISLSMFAHAGIKGVWGFGILSMLLGAFLPGDDDDFENWLQDALLIEGDGAGVAAWNWTMGMVLNGVPGTVLDTDLTGRIGMPDLWFRGSQKDLDGKDLWAYYVEQVAGPVVGIGGSALTGASMLADGEWMRGGEKMVPKFAGSLIKSARYVGDGVTTYRGDPIIERVNPYEALTTAMGFTPARVSERYRANTWLKNQEAKIMDKRKGIMGDIAKSIKSGAGVTPDLATKVREWNVKYPFYPITADGLRQSIASRQRMSQQNQGGVNLNPKLDRHLREQVAPAVR